MEAEIELINKDIFFKTIVEKTIVIYGTGYVGRTFLKVLRNNHLEKRIACFTQTTVDEDFVFERIKVKPIEYVKKLKNVIVCVAVHENYKDEVIRNLEKNEVYNYMWVYPIMHSLIFGDPIKKNIAISVAEIARINLNDYRIATRYLAIDNYYGKNSIGYSIYLKLMELQVPHESAMKRLSKFINLINKWDEYGYDSTKSIAVLEGGYLIDGTHRLTLGLYKGLQKMTCDVYNTNLYNEGLGLLGNDAAMDKKFIGQRIEDKEIIKKLDETLNLIQIMCENRCNFIVG